MLGGAEPEQKAVLLEERYQELKEPLSALMPARSARAA